MIATTIEQSKELLRLGLPDGSADMCWCNSHDVDRWFLAPRTENEIRESLLDQEQDEVEIISAWSLGALLEVISKVTCISYLTIDTSYLIRCKDLGFLWQKDIAAKYPITAAYEMVCWLLEQGLIKKGDNDE